MKATATELKQSTGKYLEKSIQEPVVIERSGRPVSVLLSYERYLEFEDAYWGRLATESDQDKSVSAKASKDFLLSDD